MDVSLKLSKDLLRHTPMALQAMLTGLPQDWITGDEGPGTWSPYQVVAHLTHVEETDWIDRTTLFLERNPGGLFRPVDREAGFTRFKGWKLGDILSAFAVARASNLESLDELVDDDDLGLKALHPSLGAVTLGQLLATWTVHDLNHLGQIVKAMAKQYQQAVGPWRSFLPILGAP